MLNSIEAVFDGQVFHPDQPVSLKANTRVRIIIENLSSAEQEKRLAAASSTGSVPPSFSSIGSPLVFQVRLDGQEISIQTTIKRKEHGIVMVQWNWRFLCPKTGFTKLY